ncbi:MAG TPA: SpoIIE family protein phosphatase [Bacteroidia bacterium]
MNYIETEEEISYKELHTEYHKLYNNNKELIDSMHYAAFVQQGILPQERHFERLFTDYFILYKPQSIIGGDLYWVGQKGGLKIFAVGDCTGHGMSGALLSVLALSFLNYIVLGKEFDLIGEVLDEMDKKWIETFQQGIELGYNNDWMEIGIVAFNAETRELQYAGAFSKLTYFINDNMHEVIGNKYPIGGWQLEKNRSFNTHKITLPPDTTLYLSSDGFKDQFGYASGKRYGSRRLKTFLQELAKLDMQQQKIKIEQEFTLWKGIEEQTDDVCVMGVKL